MEPRPRQATRSAGAGSPVAISGPGVIAVPAQSFMWTATVTSLFNLGFEAPPGSEVRLIQNGTTIAEKRNIAAHHVLTNRHLEWLLFVDTDMQIPQGALRRLLESEEEIVGALYVERQRDHELSGQSFVSAGFLSAGSIIPLTRWDGSLRAVDVVGAGCLRVRRSRL